MEKSLRRVIRLGRSALAMTFPKDWVEAVKLKGGDYVLVEQLEDGIQISKAEGEAEAAPAVCIVNADTCKDPGMLTRILTGAYVVGHNVIWLQVRNQFKPEHLEEANAANQKLVGLTITERTDNIMVIENLTDPSRPTVDSSIRRFQLTILDMYNSAIKSLIEYDEKRIEHIFSLGKECDRLYWLVVRQLLTAAQDRRLMKSLGIHSILWLLGDRAVFILLKLVVNKIERLAESVQKLIEQRCTLTAEVKSRFEELGAHLREVSMAAIDALITRDISQANGAINKILVELEMKFQGTEELISQQTQQCFLVPPTQILEALRGISICYKTIAEVAINRAVEESGKLVTVELPRKVR